MRKIYRPYDVFDFGKYKDEKCDFVYTFHPEYFEWLLTRKKNARFCIDINDYKDLHTCPFAQQNSVDSKYYNEIITLEYDEEFDAMGQKTVPLRKYLTEYMDLYELHYLNKPKEKKLYIFNYVAIEKNELNLEIYRLEQKTIVNNI